MTERLPVRCIGPTSQSRSIGVGLLLILCFVTRGTGAQESDRPRWLLNVDGPTGTVRQLRFVPETDHLIAAGIDKTVNEWILHRPDDAARPQAVRASTLRWPISRGSRGSISALDVSPSGRLVAIAGLAAHNTNGDVWLFDRLRRELQRVLVGHQVPVVSVSFSPDERWLASGDRSGELRLWDLAPDQAEPRDRLVTAAGPHEMFIQPVLFSPQGTLLHARIVGAEQRLHEHATDGRLLRVLYKTKKDPVTALARAVDSAAWAAGFLSGDVATSAGPNRPMARLGREGAEVTCLAFGPANRLLLTSVMEAGQAQLELWDVSPGAARRLERRSLGALDHAYACAISDDGQWAAAYANEPGELQIFELTAPDGTTREAPLSAPPAVRLASGEKIEGLQFGHDPANPPNDPQSDPQRLLLLDLPGDMPRRWGFDLRTAELRRMVPPPPQPQPAEEERAPAPQQRPAPQNAGRPIDQSSTMNGSTACSVTIRSDRRGITVRNSIVPAAAPGIEILLDERQGFITSWLCLPHSTDEVLWLAIGTAPDGLYLYRIDRGTAPKLVRYYRDHSGPVTHLAATNDGRWLASTAEDRHVKVWSLAGIDNKDLLTARWGATFTREGNEVRVQSVEPWSLAARRSLRRGTRITRLFTDDDPDVANRPDEILRRLEESPPWTEFSLYLDDTTKPRQVVPGWPPAVSLFVERTGEWAAWSPEGYFNASPDGETLFGWIVNRGHQVEPDFYTAGRFREEFERPDLLQEALGVANARIQAKGLSDLAEVATPQPDVQLLSPLPGEFFAAGDRVTISARVDAQGGSIPADAVDAFINFIPVAEPPSIQGETVTWETTWPGGYNVNKIEIVLNSQGDNRLPSHDAVYVRSHEPQADRLRIHVLAYGVSDYVRRRAAASVIWNLPNAEEDAHAFVDALERHAGPHYELGTIRTRTSRDFEQDKLLRELNGLTRLAEDWDPERDLLLIYFAGHGASAKGVFHFLAPDSRLEQLSREAVYLDPDWIEAVGIPWTTFERALALPCRKLFVLDACHAGQVVGRAELERKGAEKLLIRQLKSRRAMVFAATTDATGSAFEHPAIPGHGLFTGQLLTAMRFKSPAPSTTPQTLHEIVDYVDVSVTNLMPAQDPVFVPKEVFHIHNWTLLPADSEPTE